MQIKASVANLPAYKKYLEVENACHEFFKTKKYLKLDLPVLSPALAPESYLEIFKTQFKYLNKFRDLYLTPSPEIFMKRLMTEGLGDCYYLGKAFRNSEPQSKLHSPEFTIIEFYKIKKDYKFLMDEVKDLLIHICEKIYGRTFLIYQGKKIELNASWEKLTIAQAFEKYAQITREEIIDHKLFLKKAGKKGYKTKNFSYVDLFSQVYVQEVEPHLGFGGRPTIIYDYPKEMAALAKLNPDRKTCQRFEFYINGIELGDCYTELTDWKEQKQRFETEVKLRKEKEAYQHKVDWNYITALKKGLPKSSGIAIGFERLGMVFCNVSDISKLKLLNIAE